MKSTVYFAPFVVMCSKNKFTIIQVSFSFVGCVEIFRCEHENFFCRLKAFIDSLLFVNQTHLMMKHNTMNDSNVYELWQWSYSRWYDHEWHR